MASDVKTYDPKLYALIIGTSPVNGVAEGTFLKATRHTDSFTRYVGTLGEVSRAHQHDRSGEFTFTLQQTSPFNDILSAQLRLDEELNGGVVPVLVNDAAGTTVLSAAKAWIRKPADVELGKDVGTREWIMDVAEYEVFVGGSLI